MPRPRVYEPDQVLDAVESLAVASGPTAVTIRAISAAVGVSNGALYHTFESRSGLMARAWIRAGRRFLAVQNALVDRALVDGDPQAPVAAVVAAADAPAVFAERYPDSSKVLLTVSREELLDSDLPDDIAIELRDLDRLLVGLLIRLAVGLWDRKDSRAVDTITTCIVDLPTAILLRRNRLANPTAREHLRASVRAVLDVGPPPLKKGT
ncbi:TetR/AcrR family transcriptional regulator [Mycobacterium cookii]|uniref:TetR family transcriptional regulator n=1 Tax=Mycobacterium cookii TaxID=1775 RepID=A0A7I7L1P9_9MYCO|nr:TetR/AcrR family transcriptional regulator [Mycobacterium cookii]MCV7333277.1 TetR/AcrR family transcriptional regulator [Mycobacterium cookii]BBX47708.1 TetR family transcriptional regulator [Mycobacterium cookii]